jgi:hypothetical protein
MCGVSLVFVSEEFEKCPERGNFFLKIGHIGDLKK